MFGCGKWVKSGSVATWWPLVLESPSTCAPLVTLVLTHKNAYKSLCHSALQPHQRFPKLDVLSASRAF